MGLQEVRAIGRGQGAGQEVRSEHGERHGQGERGEQELADPGHEHHRQEHDHCGDGGDKHRHGDLGRAVKCCLDRRLPHRQMPECVLDVHDRVVHQPTHHEGQSA